MSGPQSDFPTLTLDEIKLIQQDITEAKKESILVKTFSQKKQNLTAVLTKKSKIDINSRII